MILDGLDEIPEELRPVALQALSEQAAFRVVVLARDAEMVAAVQRSRLDGAVALELQDVDPSAAADHLKRVQLDPPPAGWSDLTGRLRNVPDSPLAKALSSPLTLTLIRDTYRTGDDVRELLDFCDAAGQGLSRDDIEDHLLDRVLPAAYAPRPGRAPPRYELQTAQRALSCIAARMNQDGTRDLAWWRIRVWASRVPRVIATGLGAGFVVGLVVDHLLNLVVGLVVGFVVSLAFGLAFGIRGRSPRRIAPMRRRQLFSRSSLRAAIVGGLVFGLVIWFAWWRFGEVLTLGLGVGLASGLVFGLALWFVFGLSQPGAGNVSPLTPLGSWRRDQIFALLVTLVGALVGWLVFALVSSLVAVLVREQSGAAVVLPSWSQIVTDILAIALVPGLMFGLLFGLAYPETWRASLAFIQLAVRWHTPVRLMRFLEDARERDVLRTVGPVYQFRHARLQDRLAARAEWQADGSPGLVMESAQRPGLRGKKQLGLRLAGGGLLAATGAIQLDLYLTGYQSIPVIGKLFLLQVIAAFALCPAVLVTGSRLAAAAGAGFALSALGGYLLVWIGFTEVRTLSGIVAGVIEVAAFAALTAFAVAPAARQAVLGVSVVVLVLLGIAVAGAGGIRPASAGGALKTTKIGGVTVLTNAKGFTLYWFGPDTPAKSVCNGTCAAYWPPVTGHLSAGPGVTGQRSTIKRSDGTPQATYNGHPLYTYIADSPGQANGNGLNLNGGLWHEVTAS